VETAVGRLVVKRRGMVAKEAFLHGARLCGQLASLAFRVRAALRSRSETRDRGVHGAGVVLHGSSVGGQRMPKGRLRPRIAVGKQRHGVAPCCHLKGWTRMILWYNDVL